MAFGRRMHPISLSFVTRVSDKPRPPSVVRDNPPFPRVWPRNPPTHSLNKIEFSSPRSINFAAWGPCLRGVRSCGAEFLLGIGGEIDLEGNGKLVSAYFSVPEPRISALENKDFLIARVICYVYFLELSW
jgi:hypothetical protein